jgi:probable HAF family extracellular repeat protein
MRAPRFLTSVIAASALVALTPAAGGTAAPSPAPAAVAPLFVADFVSTAATGVAMNDAGDVTGTSYRDTGCGPFCLPPQDTVVWHDGQRIVLPSIPGLPGIYVRDINALGWVVGLAGLPGTTTHAVLWRPDGTGYTATDLGTLPGTSISEAVGIDDQGRVVGWSTTATFPPNGSPFLWSEATGMVDLSAQGYPDEAPLAISPGGTVATLTSWYRLGEPGSAATLPAPLATPTTPRRDLIGFAAVLAAVAAGYLLTDRFGPPLARALLGGWLEGSGMPGALQKRWLDLATLLAGIAFTLPLAAWAARRARYETLLGGLRSYFSQRGAAAILLLIVLYKLGDAFAGALMTPFLLKSMAYTSAEVGVVNKVIGLWLTIGGALLGGLWMIRLGLWRSLMLFGVLQLLSNLGFWWLAVSGKGALPGTVIPAFDWGFVALAQPTPVDGGLLLVVAFENISGGMGTAAFLAFLMSLCNQRFTATQFALLSAFASVGRVWVGPLAGVLAESIGWPTFFLISTVVAAPGLMMLWWLRSSVRGLEPTRAGALDD